MLQKILNFVVLIPLGIVLIVLCVANRQSVTLGFNPFDPSDTVLSISGPFFVFLFLAVILGLLIGASAVWFSQGKYRKRSRIEAKEALKWHTEAEKRRLQQEALAASQATNPSTATRPARPMIGTQATPAR
jgi:uncharacterized integral membrane protein